MIKHVLQSGKPSCTRNDVERDRILLSELPNASTTFLVEPPLQSLTDQLWLNGWEFFAGHSSSRIDNDTGQLVLNSSDRLTISQLKHAMKKAIAGGLKLAIFNSCDGLGLARELSDLQIPYLIVMREPVPDLVAQAFLKNFLISFSSGKPLYESIRESREKLQGLKDSFPCATWLPVIYQNLAEPSLTWDDL
ncbi:CHAT domain-containing protein [Leptolyngbya sp. AN03gr2]|uniref:CHAT domain-containing protein n=1 Tax=unclassified Leptolyngbya TaxID=2650499 RepID=UPI003D31C3A0